MSKTKIFCDIDNTTTMSTVAFCQAYNEIYFNASGFKPADPDRVKLYSLMDECPLTKNQAGIDYIFSSYEFWHFLQPFPNAIEVLKELNEKYEIILCSIGVYMNLSHKAKWIKNNLDFIKSCILINNGGNNKMDKSMINMFGGIMIDDVKSNLASSNANDLICFGEEYDWNKDLPIWMLRLKTWEDVYKFLK